MKLNTPKSVPVLRTHEGAVAKHINAEQQLRRSVLSCMLWESEFYESGESIAKRIGELIAQNRPEAVAAVAVEAREQMKLRHVPLLIVREMARLAGHKGLVAETLERVIQRPDELTEFCAIWQKDQGDKPLSKSLSAQAKKGLARAFVKFDEYALAKYNRDGAVKLRDVLFLSHAKPKDKVQAALWKRLIDGELETPDTWEVSLSGGADKKEAFTRLLNEGKLGALALLRNLRNMQQADVSEALIKEGLATMKTERVLPFRFISAARFAPRLEPELEAAMFRCLAGADKIAGKTVLLVDVSGSMNSPISAKSDLRRLDAAYGLAMLLREVCEDVAIYTFSMKLCEIPVRRGFALRDALDKSQDHSGTPLGLAIDCIYGDKNRSLSQVQVRDWSGGFQTLPANYRGQGLAPDRLIVITDEQSADAVPDPAVGRGYMLNVASAKNGVGYGKWLHIDGWSEAVVDYIRTYEALIGAAAE